MPAITHEQLLVVGVTEIDRQHLEIALMINRFHDALLSPDPALLDAERDRLWGSLLRIFTEHFASEEQFMIRIGYPGYVDHASKHRKFLDTIEKVRSDVEAGFLPLNSELIKTLSRWFLDHETIEDKGYAAYHRASPTH